MLLREESAGYMTNWAARLFARAIDSRIRTLGLSNGMLPVFFALSGGKALSQKELTEIAAVEQPTMAATISRMERDGYILREADVIDRRRQLIRLTDKAERKAARVRDVVRDVNAEAFNGLTEEEQGVFMSLMSRVVSSLGKVVSERSDQP